VTGDSCGTASETNTETAALESRDITAYQGDVASIWPSPSAALILLHQLPPTSGLSYYFALFPNRVNFYTTCLDGGPLVDLGRAGCLLMQLLTTALERNKES
jgi:hypothetical protein